MSLSRIGAAAWPLLVALGTLTCGGVVIPDPQPRGMCDDFEVSIERIWSVEQKSHVKSAVGRFSRETEATISEKIVAKMDEVLQDWVFKRKAACMDCFVRGTAQSEDKYFYRLASGCYDAELAGHRILIGELQVADRNVAVNAIDAMMKVRDETAGCIERAADKTRSAYAAAAHAPPPEPELPAATAPEPVSHDDEDLARAKVARYLKKDEEASKATDKVMERATAGNDLPLKAKVLIEQAKNDYAFARYDDAYRKYEEAGNIYVSLEDMLGAAGAAMGLAEVLADNGLYGRAIQLYVEVEKIYQGTIGTNTREYAALLIAYAEVLHSVGRAKEAFEFAWSAFDILKGIVGATGSDAEADRKITEFRAEIGDCFNMFGVEADYLGDFEKSVEWTVRAVQVFGDLYGMNHPEVATNLANLGWIYASNGEYDRAYEYANKAKDIVTGLYGYYHPEVCFSLETLGRIAALKGDFGTALQYYEMSLKVKTQYYAGEHPSIAATHVVMGDVYFTMKQYQDAYTQYETALGIYQTAFAGEEHPYVALALNLLGRTLQLNGEYEAALEKIEAAITIYKNAFGETSPDLAWALLDRGVSLKELKKGRKACKDFLAAYDMLKNAYGESHKYVALAATYTEECK